MSLSVVLPAYKEAENLEILLPQIIKVLSTMGVPYEVLVIDSRQKYDNTEQICIANACNYIKRENGDYYGDAIRTGIKFAKMNYLLIMDADGSHNPHDIPMIYETMRSGEFNVIIGSRYTKGGNSSNNLILKFMSYIVNLTYRVIFRIKAKDVSNSFKMYHTKQMKSLELHCNNFDIVEEILIRLSILHSEFSIKEVPIYFNKRIHGESKRDLLLFILSYISTIHRMYKIRLQVLKTNKLKNYNQELEAKNTINSHTNM